MSTGKLATDAENVGSGIVQPTSAHAPRRGQGRAPRHRLSRGTNLGLAATACLWCLGSGDLRAAPVYETVVTAPRPPAHEAREDTTAAASVITKDRTPRSAEDLPQLLSELPGVTVTRYGSYGSLATLSLRGSAANQVAVYADGVPLSSGVVGAVDLGLVPLSPIGRIEVYRGASPLPFGTSAMGGVVSLTGERPTASGISAHTGLGSFATRLGGGELAYVGNRVTVVASAAGLTTDADFPYHSDNRTLFDPSDDRTLRRQNNQLSQIDAALRTTLALPGRRQLALALVGVDREQGLPARGTDESFEATLARRRAHASLTYEGQDDLGHGGRLRAVVYGLGAEQRFSDPRGEIAFGPSATRDRSFTAGSTVVARRSFGPHFLLAGLLDGRREGFYPHDELRAGTRPDGHRSFGAAGLAATWFVDAPDLEITGTLRAEAAHDTISPVGLFASSSPPPTTSRELLPVARLGLLLRLNEAWQLRANGGTYARLPTLHERYGNGGTIRGNPRLIPERGESTDAGVRYAHAFADGYALALDAGIFAARSRELIQFEQMGYFGGYANVARARAYGAELGVSAQAAKYLRLTLSSTFIDAIDRGDRSSSRGRHLPHQPALHGYVRPELRSLPLGPRFRLGAYGDLEVATSRYADPANLVEQPGRRVFGAGVSLAYLPARLRTVLSAYNLGDERAADVLEYPLPGRSFFVTLEFAYSKEELHP
jgi:vitamin B12 transporter